MFTDFFQRTITDVGAIGPDRARGGLYLLLPPDYDSEVPKGYFAFKSPTYNVFLFFRTIMKKGEDGPDPKPAVALAEQTRVYPLWAVEKDVTPMVFPNGSGKRVNMMYPVDNTYWTKLKAFVDYEPASAIDPELRGPGLDRHHQGTALQPDRPTAGAAEESGRDRAEDHYGDAPARPARWARSLLQRPPVSEYLGRRDVRVAAGELFGREPAGGLFPDRLFVGACHGHAYD
jgi:hypothetical protein